MTDDAGLAQDQAETAEGLRRGSLMRSGTARELSAALAVMLFFGTLGAIYIGSVPGKVRGYTDQFGPAVMVATGRGFTEPVPNESPILDRFLAMEVDQIFPEDLPSNLRTKQPNVFQNAHSFLLYSVALVWYLFGISWSSLCVLAGCLFGFSCAFVYGIFRFGAGRVWAIAGTILFATSPFHLGQLDSLRDYSKAPFLLGVILICCCLAKWEVKRSRVIFLCACCGLLIGVGRGFRLDVILGIPFLIATVMLFCPGGILRHKLTKGLALGAFALVFLLCGLGIRANTNGGSTFHVILMGLNSSLDKAVGVEPAHYEIAGHKLYDWYVWSTVTDYNQRHHNEAVGFITPEYDKAAARYYWEVMTTFPADMYTRILASLNTVLTEIPFGRYDAGYVGGSRWQSGSHGLQDRLGHLASDRIYAPLAVKNQVLLTLFRVRGELAGHLRRFGVALAALAIFALGVRSTRLSLFALFVLLYFGGSLALQFDIRHVFHMQFMAWWALLFLLNAAILPVWNKERRAGIVKVLRAPKTWYGAARRPVVLAAAILALALIPLYLLRWHQERSLERLFEQYASAPVEEVSLVQEPFEPPAPGGERRVLLRPQVAGNAAVEKGRLRSDYVVVEIGGSAGETRDSITFTALFEGSYWWTDYSRDVILPLPPPGEITKVFLPVYAHTLPRGRLISSSFRGILVPESDLPYISGVWRLKDTSSMPLLLSLVLPADWKDLPHYQPIIRPGRNRDWVVVRGLGITPVLGQSILGG